MLKPKRVEGQEKQEPTVIVVGDYVTFTIGKWSFVLKFSPRRKP